MTTFGPYETEQAAATEPLGQAVRNLPHDPANPGRASRDLQLSFLREACVDAGVELGGYDRRILAWLSSYEPATVQVFIGLISRAYAAGRRDGASLAPTPSGCARFGLAIDSNNGHHVRFRLFAATGGQHLGGCGALVMQADEYAAFERLLAPALTDRPDPSGQEGRASRG